MPDTSFYINDQERKELFNYLKEHHAIFIPDKRYYNHSLEYVEDADEFLRISEEETVGFFVISPDYTEQDLLLRKNEFANNAYSIIIQRRGGPYIDLSLYRGYAESAGIKYKSTHVGHYARYVDINEIGWEMFASDELKAYYKNVLKFLKAKCKRVRGSDDRPYWVSRLVLEEIAARESEAK